MHGFNAAFLSITKASAIMRCEVFIYHSTFVLIIRENPNLFPASELFTKSSESVRWQQKTALCTKEAINFAIT
jgi:hypothetical protein